MRIPVDPPGMPQDRPDVVGQAGYTSHRGLSSRLLPTSGTLLPTSASLPTPSPRENQPPKGTASATGVDPRNRRVPLSGQPNGSPTINRKVATHAGQSAKKSHMPETHRTSAAVVPKSNGAAAKQQIAHEMQSLASKQPKSTIRKLVHAADAHEPRKKSGARDTNASPTLAKPPDQVRRGGPLKPKDSGTTVDSAGPRLHRSPSAVNTSSNCIGNEGEGIHGTCKKGPTCPFHKDSKCRFYHPCSSQKCTRVLCAGTPNSTKKTTALKAYQKYKPTTSVPKQSAAEIQMTAATATTPPSSENKSAAARREPKLEESKAKKGSCERSLAADRQCGARSPNKKPEKGGKHQQDVTYHIGRIKTVKKTEGFGFITPEAMVGDFQRSPSAAKAGNLEVTGKTCFKRGRQQVQDIHFRLSDVATAGFSLRANDEVQYRLRRDTNEQKPHADRVKLTKLSARSDQEYKGFLLDLVTKLKQGKLDALQCVSEFPTIWKGVVVPRRQKGRMDAAMADEVGDQLAELMRLLQHHINAGSKAAAAVLRDVVANGGLDEGGHLFQRAREHVQAAGRFAAGPETEACVTVFRSAATVRSRVLPYVELVAAPSPESEPQLRFLLGLLRAATVSATDAMCLEWHDLPLVITPSEFDSADPHLSSVRVRGGYETTECYFETYFRLLREDCFSTLRTCVAQWRAGQLDTRDMQVFVSVRVVGLAAPDERSGNGTILALDVGVAVKDGDKRLMFGNLVAISSAISGDVRQPVWATICRRDERQPKTLMVELCTSLNSHDDAADLRALLNAPCVVAISPTFYRSYQPVLAALQCMARGSMPFAEELVHVRSPAPQAVTLLSQAATVDGRCVFPDAGNRMSTVEFLHHLTASESAGTTFDKSQLAAVTHVLKNRVAIVQGPPGTGKTFIGTRLVRMLLSMRDTEDKPVVHTPIVVLTYKNHALDDFLTSCLDPAVVGEDGVGRIGGGSIEGSKLYNCNLTNLIRAPAPAAHRKTRDVVVGAVRRERDAVAESRTKLEDALGKLADAQKFGVASLQTAANQQQLRSLILDCSPTDFRRAVQACRGKFNLRDPSRESIIAALPAGEGGDSAEPDKAVSGGVIPAAAEAIAAELLLRWFKGVTAPTAVVADADSGNAVLVGQMQSQDDYDGTERERLQHFEDNPGPTQTLAAGKRGPLYTVSKVDPTDRAGSTGVSENERAILLNRHNVWCLSGDERGKLVDVLLSRRYEAASAVYTEAQAEYTEACDRLRRARDRERTEVLRTKAVVGMTITGASIYRDVLIQLEPSVVIVEEAAEVLEPQLLAALGPFVKQLIMIGDHQQLPPSVETHVLATKYHFGVSMMERLINNKLPFVTLEQQGRMRPELAILLTDIYPTLTTNQAVVDDSSRPAPRCAAKSVYFWDHTDKEQGDRGYHNPGEADRVAALALFFVTQGYRPSKITVLGAYAKQVTVLREKLAAGLPKVWRGEIANREQRDKLAEIKVMAQNKTPSPRQSYDLALLLLSRSNPEDLRAAMSQLETADASASGDLQPIVVDVLRGVRNLSKSAKDLVAAVENSPDSRETIKAAKDMFLLGRQHQIDNHPELAEATFMELARSLTDSEDKRLNAVRTEAQSALKDLRRERNSIEVHTIDRFQGAENDIVIVSLVRSEGLGFLGKLNRRCVAQSRARCGLYFVGNAELLSRSDAWKPFLERLGQQGCLGSRITLQCAEHPTVSVVHAETAADIDLTGGICQLPCLKPMAFCDHMCKLKCHPDTGHYLCRHPVAREACPQKHLVQQECSFPRDESCKACTDERARAEQHQANLDQLRQAHEDEVAKQKKQRQQDQHKLIEMQERHAIELKQAIETRKAEVKKATARQQRDDAKRIQAERLGAIERDTQQKVKEVRGRRQPYLRKNLENRGASAATYNEIVDRTEKYVQHVHGRVVVKRIEELQNSQLEERWLKSRAGLKDPTAKSTPLFHGTSSEGVEGISHEGFRLPAWSDSNMFGCGAYFATDSSKSAQNIYTKGSGMLLLCDVWLGKPCTIKGLTSEHPLKKHVKNSRNGRPFLDVDLRKVRKEGFDSVYAERDGNRSHHGVQFDEYIVYNHECALPRYIVHFNRNESPSMRPRAFGQKITIKDPAETVSNNPDVHFFHEASSQFFRLLNNTAPPKILSVDYYGADNSPLKRKFDEMQKKFRSKGVSDQPIWVFHGTSSNAAIESIMKDGFKIGGVDTAIANGAAYGHGVYTAIGPGTPMGYGRTTKSVILAKALPGEDGLQGINDSWRPQSLADWRIFKLSDQVLPYYVLHFE